MSRLDDLGRNGQAGLLGEWTRGLGVGVIGEWTAGDPPAARPLKHNEERHRQNPPHTMILEPGARERAVRAPASRTRKNAARMVDRRSNGTSPIPEVCASCRGGSGYLQVQLLRDPI